MPTAITRAPHSYDCRVRSAIVIACGLAGACGRIGFDATGDGGVASVFTPIQLPVGGTFSDIVRASDGTLYAVVDGGYAIRSSDAGATWTRCGRDPALISHLVVDPATGAVFTIGGSIDVAASYDGCATWQVLDLAGAYEGVAVTNGTLLAGTQDGVWTYDGAGWARAGLAGQTINDIAVAGSTVYVATADGMACSTDGGITFPACNNGFTQLDVIFVVADPANPQHAYTMTSQDNAASFQTYHSLDGGASWQLDNLGGGQTIGLDPSDDAFVVFYSWDYGLIASTNAGVAYDGIDHRSPEMATTEIEAFAYGVGSQLFAATERGLFVANDHTLAWRQLDPGIDAWQISQIVVDPSGVILLATPAGVLRSTDGGASWTEFSSDFGGISETRSIAPSPASTSTYLTESGTQLALTDNQAQTFTPLVTLGPADNYHAERVHYVGSTIIAATWGGVTISTDGTTFNHADIGAPGTFVDDVIAVDDSATTLAAATAEDGVYISTNGGGTWTQTTVGLGDLTIEGIAKLDDGTLLAETEHGLYRSTAPYDQWTATGFAGVEVDDVLVQGAKLVAATQAGVYASDDAGATWRLLPGLEQAFPGTVAADNAGHLLVGTYGNGLYETAMP